MMQWKISLKKASLRGKEMFKSAPGLQYEKWKYEKTNEKIYSQLKGIQLKMLIVFHKNYFCLFFVLLNNYDSQ